MGDKGCKFIIPTLHSQIILFPYTSLLPSAANMRRSAKILNFNLRRDHQKISYERRDYESVDKKRLSWAMSRKTTKKKIRQ